MHDLSAPLPQLRPQVPVPRMTQEPGVKVTHLPGGPDVLEFELAVVVADAEVAARPVVRGPWPSRILPAEAVAV